MFGRGYRCFSNSTVGACIKFQVFSICDSDTFLEMKNEGPEKLTALRTCSGPPLSVSVVIELLGFDDYSELVCILFV